MEQLLGSFEYTGVIFGLYWVYIGFLLDLCWVSVGFVFGLCWVYIGFILAIRSLPTNRPEPQTP